MEREKDGNVISSGVERSGLEGDERGIRSLDFARDDMVLAGWAGRGREMGEISKVDRAVPSAVLKYVLVPVILFSTSLGTATSTLEGLDGQ